MLDNCQTEMDMETEATELNEIPNHKESGSGSKSWVEHRSIVRRVRQEFSSMSPKTPTCYEFREIVAENESRFYRIYFLSSVNNGRGSTLLYSDVPVDCIRREMETFQWKPLLDAFPTYVSSSQLSREEQLQCERKRIWMWGISSFDFQPSIGRFVFSSLGSVYYCDDDLSQQPPLALFRMANSLKTRLNPQMCPNNPNLIAFVNEYDLWVHNVITSCDTRLTFERNSSKELSDNPFSAGIPAYVTQEEFNRFTGFWWQPCTLPCDDIYRILYEEVDESDVDIVYLPGSSNDKDREAFRFPRAGTSNAKSALKIVEFKVLPINKILIMSYLQPNQSMQKICPDMEYLVRVGWTPDGQNIWAEVLDRQQCAEYLLFFPLTSFVDPDASNAAAMTNHVEDHFVPQVIYADKSDIWINVHDVLYFFAQMNPNDLTFLWASEESGFRHLYVITVELLKTSSCKEEADYLKRIKRKVPITQGEWEVSELNVWVNEKKRLIFFIGLKDTPLEKHLYVVDIDNPQEPLRMTTLGFSHSIAMNEDCTLFIAMQSNINQPACGQVYQIYYSVNYPFSVSIQTLGNFLDPIVLPLNYRYPELFDHTIESGHKIYGLILKPPNMKPGEKYPTVLTIYGGPEVQLITNSFKGVRYLRQYLLSSEGYVVVMIDCRGSRHRGVQFESHIKGRMGTVEIADQVEVLLWLSETMGIIDLQRVAVHGWSYGGYLALMALIQRPDIFKIAIAGAPVTSWMLYDTGYTERFMGKPDENPQGYKTGSVLNNAHLFPDEENRLLIIHGLKDENVHFTHTSQLINALVKAGKPYDLKVYPSERHSLRNLECSEHYETILLNYLGKYL